MKISKVEIEGFHNIDRKSIELNDINYFQGPNGVGKSTVLQAIQLGLLGYIPGTNKTNAAIFRHANGRMMSVTLTFEDGSSICRMWMGANSSVTSKVEILPEGMEEGLMQYLEYNLEDIELPVFNFGDFTSMTANKLKDWFINFLPSQDVEIDWKDELTRVMETEEITVTDEFLNETLADIEKCEGQGIDKIRDVNRCLKETISFKKSTHKRLENTIQSLIYHDDIEDFDEEEVRNRIDDLREKQNIRRIYDGVVSSNKIARDELEKLGNLAESIDEDYEYQNWKSLIDDLKSKKDDLKSALNEFHTTHAKYLYDKKSIEDFLEDSTTCPYTKRECGTISSMRDAKKYELDEIKSALSEIKHQTQVLNDDMNEVEDRMQSVDTNIRVRESSYERRDVLRSNLVDEPILEDERTIVEIQKEIDELIDIRNKFEVNRSYNTMIDSLVTGKYEIENELEALKAWEKLTGVNGLQSSGESAKPFEYFSNVLNTYIKRLFGEDVESSFNIKNSANSFSFGIVRSGKYISYDTLSSGEKCMYTLSLIASLMDMTKSDIRLIMIDDLFDHLDSNNINQVFTLIKEIENIQMILAGVYPVEVIEAHTIHMN